MAAVPTAQKLRAQIWLARGDTDGETEQLLSFTESDSVTGNLIERIGKKYAPAAANQTIDLSTFSVTATYIMIRDLGGTGINVALDAAGVKFQIAANGVMVFKNANATPPTLYLTNPDAINNAYIEVGVLGSRS